MNPEAVLILVRLAYAAGASDEINFRILEGQNRSPESVDDAARTRYPTAEAFQVEGRK